MDVNQLAHQGLAQQGLLSDLFSKETKQAPDLHAKYSVYPDSDAEYDAFEQGAMDFGQWSAEGGETSSSYMCRDDDEVASVCSSLMSHGGQDITSELLKQKSAKKSLPQDQIYSGAQLLVDDSLGSAFVF